MIARACLASEACEVGRHRHRDFVVGGPSQLFHHGLVGPPIDTTYGMLLVPDPAKLDTRRAMSPDVRRDQLGQPAADVFDARLTSGTSGSAPVRTGRWSPPSPGPTGSASTATSNVSGGPAETFIVEGHDTRALMIRQIWGARILQRGPNLPDCEANDHWTFTLSAAEKLIEGCVESGTVLKGRV